MRNTIAQDKAKFGELFVKDYSRMFYYALDFVGDKETARDIVSDVTCETWSKLGKLLAADPNLNISSYMLRAIRNSALNLLRHKAVEDTYIKKMLSVREDIAAEPTEEHEERLQLLWTTLESFDLETRRILKLCCFEGKKYKEVADELGITQGLVHKRISKAFAVLRKTFGVKFCSATVTIIGTLLLFL